MIKSIGTDLVEISRIEEIGIEKFADRILDQEEKNEFKLITHQNRKLSYLAGRFAAKEALFKCFKQGDKTASYKDFRILNDSVGAPYVLSTHTLNYEVHITISHTNTHAIAFVVLETKV